MQRQVLLTCLPLPGSSWFGILSLAISIPRKKKTDNIHPSLPYLHWLLGLKDHLKFAYINDIQSKSEWFPIWPKQLHSPCLFCGNLHNCQERRSSKHSESSEENVTGQGQASLHFLIDAIIFPVMTATEAVHIGCIWIRDWSDKFSLDLMGNCQAFLKRTSETRRIWSKPSRDDGLVLVLAIGSA